VRCQAVELVVFMGEHDPFVGGQGPQALVSRGRREPRPHAVRMFDPLDVLDQAHPGCLENVRRIALDEFEVPGDRPDEAAIAVNQALPGLRIAVGGPAHQPGRVEIRDVGAGCREACRGRPFDVLLRYCRASRHRPP
jgi:hypothetical protein